MTANAADGSKASVLSERKRNHYMSQTQPVTELLQKWRAGDSEALIYK